MVKNKQQEEEFEIEDLFNDIDGDIAGEDYVNSPPHITRQVSKLLMLLKLPLQMALNTIYKVIY